MAADSAWRESWAKRAQVSAIATLGWPLIEALAGTWTFRATGANHFDALARVGEVPILAFWHGRILAGLPYFRDRGIVVITSENFDGEWIARIIAKFGYGAARGSSSRGGAKALVQMRRTLAAGQPVAFTVDGPRGPARVAQPGAAWLAGATGHPIVPFHVEADPYWTVNSWDRQQIPKPGATISINIGEPLYVANTEEASVERGRLQLEAAMRSLEQSPNPNPQSSILNPQ
ncbi:MAG: DUF374 domain-containing protein [Acidimicrobiia bacterium]|nr:DUF374 domain-containing protein [Acidimicrobiia bacterium]